jgi:hypothetical protein
MTDSRIDYLNREIALLEARLRQPLTEETRYRLKGERIELNSELARLETERFQHEIRLG